MPDRVGILAYGSLIGDPGPEIEPHMIRRIPCNTPFKVEFARASRTRTGGPSLIPHDGGSHVAAQILVVDLPLKEATDRLYRRELAVESARARQDGKKGISYLMNAKKCGIQTPLSPDYEKEILRLTGAHSLEAALASTHA